LNRDASTIWIRAGAAVFFAVLVAAAVWYFFGPRWGASAGFVFALLLLGRHLANAEALLRWLLDQKRPVPDGSGIWEDIFAELHRLSKSQRLEHERLTSALARFRSAGTAMPDAVVILDAENHIEWCNPMAERFLGIDAVKDAGQTIINLVRAPDFAAYLRQGAYGDPLVIRLVRDEELTLSLRVIAYGQDQKLLLCRDVTQASRLETMRRDFVANVSHELKTPLTVVNGFLETLVDAKIRFTEARSREIFGLMQQQTARMMRLVEDLLTLSALESSPGLSDESEIDTVTLLESLHEEGLALSAGRHRVTMDVGDAALIVGAESELRSAFGNLVANAVHYTQAGGQVRIGWRIRESGEGEFSVTDSGVGFEAHHIPRLTERFYRIDQSRSRETGGTGLGLAIVKHVLTRHQAGLEISSEPGRGSRFAAVLPARRVRLTANQAPASTQKLARS
jgi:two-component system phosphate regulon sensor histidine kinase PhoR